MSALLLLAAAASACPVCFGDDGSSWAGAITWGIVLLLAATGAMVTGVAAMAYRIEKARHD